MGPVGRPPRSPWSLTAPAVTSTPNWLGWCCRTPCLPSPPSVRKIPSLRSSRSGAALSRESRLLAAADVLHALGESRPHRPAHDLDSAARVLTLEAKEGRLDPDAVAAVIEAAGAPRPRRAWPADLTDREVDVLRLAARGFSNKAIAEALVISPRTVQHHLAHIYDKTGRRSRAGNALFAMEHGLLEPIGGS